MNLWLVPASNDEAEANLPITLTRPIGDIRAERASHPKIAPGGRAWGTRWGNAGLFAQMHPRDYCLFYTRVGGNPRDKAFCWIARVTDMENNEALSRALWDSSEFPLVYIIDEVRAIRVTQEHIREQLSEFGVPIPWPLRRLTRVDCSPEVSAWLESF